jgi:hypothetical protein
MLALVVGANAARRTVNVAARVEQLTKTTGDRISLIHHTVDALVARPSGLTDRGSHALKGKSAAVQVFASTHNAICLGCHQDELLRPHRLMMPGLGMAGTGTGDHHDRTGASPAPATESPGPNRSSFVGLSGACAVAPSAT